MREGGSSGQRGMGEGVEVGRDGGQISGQGGMGKRVVGREGWGRE